MGKPTAPTPPDYAAAAREQGAANVNSTLATNYLNQVNQSGPYGTLNYSYDPAAGHTLPDGTTIPSTTATTTLSPDQQTLLDQNTTLSKNLNDLAIQGVGNVASEVGRPLPPIQGIPLVSDVGARPIDPSIAPSTVGLATSAGTKGLQTGYDYSGAAALPGQNDYMDARDRITNAMLERLQPQMDRDRAGLDTRLANQGLNRGSEAYNWDQDQLQRGINDQRIAVLLAGDQEQQRLFSNQTQLHNIGIADTQAQGNFFNNAQNSMWQQGHENALLQQAARSQEFMENQAREQARTQAQQIDFSQGLARAGLTNATSAQNLQQQIQQQEYERTAQLNLLNALRSGNQVNLPQFGNVATGANFQPPPIYQAAQDQYSAAMQAYQAQLAARGGLFSGLGSLGGGLASAAFRR